MSKCSYWNDDSDIQTALNRLKIQNRHHELLSFEWRRWYQDDSRSKWIFTSRFGPPGIRFGWRNHPRVLAYMRAKFFSALIEANENPWATIVIKHGTAIKIDRETGQVVK